MIERLKLDNQTTPRPAGEPCQPGGSAAARTDIPARAPPIQDLQDFAAQYLFSRRPNDLVHYGTSSRPREGGLRNLYILVSARPRAAGRWRLRFSASPLPF